MKKYYIHNGSVQQGPYDLEDLKSKHLTRETPVWYEGLDDWTIAGQVHELREVLSTITPPPFKASPMIPPPFEKKRSNFLGVTMGIAVILVTLMITMMVIGKVNKMEEHAANQPAQTYQQKVLTVEETERLQPVRFLKVAGEHTENVWGTKLKVHGTIQNKATVVSYKDAVVRVSFYDKDKKALGSKDYTITDSFPPYSEVKFELKIENDQPVTDLKYAIVKAKSLSR